MVIVQCGHMPSSNANKDINRSVLPTALVPLCISLLFALSAILPNNFMTQAYSDHPDTE